MSIVTKVLFHWEIDKVLKDHFKKKFLNNKRVELIFPKDLSVKNLIRLAKDADVIVGWRPSIELLRASEKLKLFINPGTGIKHHIENFRELQKTANVTLVNGHGHAYSTAQHTVAMLLTLMNRIVSHHDQMVNGVWRMSDDKDVMSSSIQLRNRKIGLLGYGAINKYVHRFLSGFENDFNILRYSWDSDKSKFPTPVKKFTSKNLKSFLKESDILIIAVPHTVLTENMIKAEELKLLGSDGILVNVARGTIVNEKDLYDSLKKKVIAGAALDVWYNYSPKKNKDGKAFPSSKPFGKLKNVVLSPHRAASPFDEISRWDEVIINILKVSKGKSDYLNIVDLDKEY